MPGMPDSSLRSRIDRFIREAPPWAAVSYPTRQDRLWAIFLAFVLIPLGSYANHLPGIGLSLTHPGALLAFAIILCVGLLAALLFSALGKHGYAPASALLAFITFDLNFSLIDGVAAAILAFALARWKGVLVLRLLWVIYAIVLVTAPFSTADDRAFIERGGAIGEGNKSLPPLIHVVLDEVGPDVALPSSDYAQWTHAYSRYHTTRMSLPEMLDGFHDRLIQRGYMLETWTSGYQDICRADARCMNYWHDNIRDFIGSDSAPTLIARLSIYSWLRSGRITRNLANDIDPRVQASHFNPVTTLKALEEFAKRIETLQPGEAATIHALLPHYPYAFDKDCTMRPADQWVGRDTAFPLDQRRRAYSAQLACLETRLARLHRDDAIVIIHGDHGTRYFDIRQGVEGRSLRAEQMRQAFSTVFAIHWPGASARTIEERATISSLLKEVADSDFATIPVGKEEQVWLGEYNFREGEMIFE